MKIFIGDNYSCNLIYQPEYISSSLVGNEIVYNPRKADIILFLGTCASTGDQLADTLAYIATISSLKKKGAKVYLTGCLAKGITIPSLKIKVDRILNECVDEIIPFDNPDRLLHLINPSRYPDFGPMEGRVSFLEEYGAANIYISNGCNNRCAFCKVNYLDLPLKSMPFDDVCKHVDRIDNYGISHLFLKGTNIAQYGYDLYHEYLLGELLDYIKEKTNISAVDLIGYGFADGIRNHQEERIRDNKTVKVISGGLESGSNNILQAMNKGFTSEEFLTFAEECQRNYAKEWVLNIIAGYPGETIDDMMQTVELLRKVKPWVVQVCPYMDFSVLPAHDLEVLSDSQIAVRANEYVRTLRKYGLNARL